MTNDTGRVLEQEALVEEVAEQLWQAEHMRVRGKPRNICWSEAGEQAHAAWRPLARAIIPLIYTAGRRAGIEEAAKVAERSVVVTLGQSVTRDLIATAIRSISEQETSRG